MFSHLNSMLSSSSASNIVFASGTSNIKYDSHDIQTAVLTTFISCSPSSVSPLSFKCSHSHLLFFLCSFSDLLLLLNLLQSTNGHVVYVVFIASPRLKRLVVTHRIGLKKRLGSTASPVDMDDSHMYTVSSIGCCYSPHIIMHMPISKADSGIE